MTPSQSNRTNPDPPRGYITRRTSCVICDTPLINLASRARGMCLSCWTTPPEKESR